MYLYTYISFSIIHKLLYNIYILLYCVEKKRLFIENNKKNNKGKIIKKKNI